MTQQLHLVNYNDPWLIAHHPILVMDFLIRFVQCHETFRKPEIEALAVLANVNVEFLFYSESVCPDSST